MSAHGDADRTSSRRWQDSTLDLLKRYWIPLVLVIAAIVFIAQNRADSRITLLWAEVVAPLWVVLAVLFLVGFLAGWLRGRRRRG